MQQYTEDTGQDHQKTLNFIDREWGIDSFFVSFLDCTQEYFPRYLWGINIAAILAVLGKTTAKTLRSVL